MQLLRNKTASRSRLISFCFHLSPSFRQCKTARSHSQEREGESARDCGGKAERSAKDCEWDSWARGQRQRAQAGSYLDKGLHIAVKQLTVKNGARSRLPHSLGFRGKSGGPGDMVRVFGKKNNNTAVTKTFKYILLLMLCWASQKHRCFQIFKMLLLHFFKLQYGS